MTINKNSYVFSVLGIYFGILISSPPLYAQDRGSSTNPATNPYEEGTRESSWTKAQIDDLKTYMQSSIAQLQQALAKADGKSFEEANDIYLTVIKSVVAESSKQKLRTETLLRYSLNEAMDLTYGIPAADGKRIQSPGVLENFANRDLLTVILEDSIALSIKYAQEDLKACEENKSLVDLPYGEYANDRIKLARKWLAATFEWNAAYDLSLAALQHWSSAIGSKDHLRYEAYADAIVKTHEVLQGEFRGKRYNDPRELVGTVRTLRKTMRYLVDYDTKTKIDRANAVKARQAKEAAAAKIKEREELLKKISPSVIDIVQLTAELDLSAKNKQIVKHWLAIVEREDHPPASDLIFMLSNLELYDDPYNEKNKSDSSTNSARRMIGVLLNKDQLNYSVKQFCTLMNQVKHYYEPDQWNKQIKEFTFIQTERRLLSRDELEELIGMLQAIKDQYDEEHSSLSKKNTKASMIDIWDTNSRKMKVGPSKD